jgi:hypothetical protein
MNSCAPLNEAGESSAIVLEQLRGTVRDFERILLAAFENKYHQLMHVPHEALPLLLSFSPAHTWPLEDFMNAYVGSNVYPDDRLTRIMNLLFDLKLQLYLLAEVDLGLYNRLVFDFAYDESRDNLRERPHIALTYLSLHQNTISKARVLWERVMNLVYFLETGVELNPRRSKRKEFRAFLTKHQEWVFLEPIADYVDHFDETYRTPELHSASVLRAALLGRKLVDPNALHLFIHPIQQVLWPNLLSLVAGGPAVQWVQFKQNPDGSYFPATGNTPPSEWPEWPGH